MEVVKMAGGVEVQEGLMELGVAVAQVVVVLLQRQPRQQKAAATSLGAAPDPVIVKSEFPQPMMQQMGTAGQGMFPMMQPHMWNMSMGPWS
jgi:hypothetical protein